ARSLKSWKPSAATVGEAVAVGGGAVGVVAIWPSAVMCPLSASTNRSELAIRVHASAMIKVARGVSRCRVGGMTFPSREAEYSSYSLGITHSSWSQASQHSWPLTAQVTQAPLPNTLSKRRRHI